MPDRDDLRPHGRPLFVDGEPDRIRRIEADGTITTIAGGGTIDGRDADGGPATGAALRSPQEILFDPQGNLYFDELRGNLVRRVDPKGILTTIAGVDGLAAAEPAGVATEQALDEPAGIVLMRQATSSSRTRTTSGSSRSIPRERSPDPRRGNGS